MRKAVHLSQVFLHSLEEEQQTRGSVTAEIAGAAPVRTARGANA